MNREEFRPGGQEKAEKKPEFEVRDLGGGLKQVVKYGEVEMPVSAGVECGPHALKKVVFEWRGKRPDPENGIPAKIELAVREWIKSQGVEAFGSEDTYTVCITDLRERAVNQEVKERVKELKEALETGKLPHWYKEGWTRESFPGTPHRTAIANRVVTEVNAFLRADQIIGSKVRKPPPKGVIIVQVEGHAGPNKSLSRQFATFGDYTGRPNTPLALLDSGSVSTALGWRDGLPDPRGSLVGRAATLADKELTEEDLGRSR